MERRQAKMRRFHFSKYPVLLAFFALIGGSGVLSADSIIFQRDLPNAVDSSGNPWVNDPAGANRANVDWLSGQADGSNWDIIGDDFSFSNDATVTSLTVYEISNVCSSGPTCTTKGFQNPALQFSSISLYLGQTQGTLSLATSSYTSVQTTYPNGSGGVSYEDDSGNFFPIYALTFTLPTPLFVPAGQDEAFAVDGVARNTKAGYGLYLAAVNATDALQSSTPSNPVVEDGADDAFIYYQEATRGDSTATYLPLPTGLGPGPNPDPTPGYCDVAPDTFNYCSGSWDKGSDLAVLINGSEVPEPGTVILTIAGILALASRLRRR
jgi:hypothetical protein